VDQAGAVSAALFHYNRFLFPIFGKTKDITLPRFMNRFPGKIPVHAIQGILGDVQMLENALVGLGYRAHEHRDYDLMALDTPPEPESLKAGPGGLTLRTPDSTDLGAILPLHAGYEKEEVLPRDVAFNTAACSLSLGRILAREQSLIACLGNQVVGKINTNAASFSRVQIGGVYVLPQYRGQGIARRITAVFAEQLISQGRGVTLFVKKENHRAQSVYRRLGFSVLADYRISYY
jgi:ribosomal protein S18 acetylase RimI-like enzyme